MIENAPMEKISALTRFGLNPFGLKTALLVHLLLSVLWLIALGLTIGSDLSALRPQTQEEINAARWQKSSDPNQLAKNQSVSPPQQNLSINDLFRPQPSGINPFDATRHAQTTATPLTADWSLRIQTGLVFASLPGLGLIMVFLFARHLRHKETAEAETKAADKARQDEERQRARRRGKGIPMRRPR